MKKNILIHLIILLTVFTQLKAQEVTIDQLVNQSFSYYPKLKEFSQQLTTTGVREEIAKASYLPNIYADVNYRRSEPIPQANFFINGRLAELKFQPADNVNFQLSATQLLYDFGRTQANLNKIKTDKNQVNDNIDILKNQLRYQVTGTYFNILFLNKSIAVQNEQIKVINDNIKLVQDKLNQGDALKLDLLNAEVRLSTAQTRLADLQNSLAKQFNNLYALTNVDYSGQIKSTDLPQLNTKITQAQDIVKFAEDNNLDLKLLKDKKEGYLRDINAANTGFLPNLTFNGNTGYKNGFQPDIAQIRWNYNATVNLNIPIFSGVAHPKWQIKLAKANIEANNYALEAQKVSLQNSLKNYLADIELNESKLKFTQPQLEQAKLSVQISQSRYKNGTITNFDLMTSQTNLQDVELSRLNYEYQVILTKLQLNQLMGVNGL